VEEILRKLETLKTQMRENAVTPEEKSDSKENQSSEKLSGIVFNLTDKDGALKGSSFAKLK
jgi:hypothetical protein